MSGMNRKGGADATVGAHGNAPAEECPQGGFSPYGQAAQDVHQEYCRATKEFGPFNSAHEGIGVLLEEFEELKVAVFTNQPLWKQRTEAKQLGAMAIRFMVDCCGGPPG